MPLVEYHQFVLLGINHILVGDFGNGVLLDLDDLDLTQAFHVLDVDCAAADCVDCHYARVVAAQAEQVVLLDRIVLLGTAHVVRDPASAPGVLQNDFIEAHEVFEFA
eukprot:CAMPEP_0116903800 /NCGR_PEP_ID=MMETSP0467-20121206/10976_1 /TAXON_ID=283647 /ORGANISM="Mesodinium pulex, Strain SPMC105" /LENGTH=106 /DNA_ID=CAMNT_0004578197 /DNA_START=335 /DNA_END=655 /DNA_ORIENTATION=-